MKNHAVIKSRKNGMNIIMDAECSFDEVCEEVEARFKENAAFWGNARMALTLEGRDLTPEESLRLVNTITENTEVDIICLIDEDPGRIEACTKAIDEKLIEMSNRTADFYYGDLKEMELLNSDKSLVILGDVAPGATVTAAGNVIVLGELKGNIYAGSPNNTKAAVAALTMAPHKIQIGEVSQYYKGKGKKLGKGAMLAVCEENTVSVKPFTRDLLGFLHFK